LRPRFRMFYRGFRTRFRAYCDSGVLHTASPTWATFIKATTADHKGGPSLHQNRKEWDCRRSVQQLPLNILNEDPLPCSSVQLLKIVMNVGRAFCLQFLFYNLSDLFQWNFTYSSYFLVAHTPDQPDLRPVKAPPGTGTAQIFGFSLFLIRFWVYYYIMF